MMCWDVEVPVLMCRVTMTLSWCSWANKHPPPPPAGAADGPKFLRTSGACRVCKEILGKYGTYPPHPLLHKIPPTLHQHTQGGI
jgi:hypothetical protein